MKKIENAQIYQAYQKTLTEGIKPVSKLQKIRAKCQELLALAEKRTPGKWDADGELKYMGDDGIFIAACAGPAEAGWRATIAAIDALNICHESSDFDDMNAWSGLEAIIAAWPDELL